MGAFNTLQLALRTPHYSKAAVLCAVVGDHLSPFSSEAELLEALRQSTAYKYHGEEGLEFMLSRIQGALHLARHFYPTLEEWNEFDPMSLALTSTTATDFYIASGFHDAFASYEGNVKLAEVLESKGLKVDWRPQWGGHCAIDIPSLARFLVE